MAFRILASPPMLLVDSADIIRDVSPIPPHSRSDPEFDGRCSVNGKASQEYLVPFCITEPALTETPPTTSDSQTRPSCQAR